MRKLAALALLFSAQAFACPNLTGNYVCRYDDGTTEKVAITQSNKAGVEVYNYNGSEIPADNISYDIPDDNNLKEGKFKAWCDDDVTLKANILAKYFSNGTYFGDLDLTTGLAMDNGALKVMSTGTLKQTDGTVHPINEAVTCAPM